MCENNLGKISVITGPMFSEKSGELIKRILKMERYGGKKVKAYKPTEDFRFEADWIVSRMGYRYPASNIPRKLTDSIIEEILVETESIDVVAFDEVQFFSKPIMGLVDELAYRGKHVICDGLNMDYREKEFGFMGGLLTMADEITNLTSYCSVCQSPHARFTQRMVNGMPAKMGPIILIGDKEDYEVRCRSCYIPPHKVRN
ncbi:thymidine kinase [Paenibacillus polymyxa]|uniref:Thymidine kinase n=1 Tax=Paenibacillus polymyxa (strain SC2) TaxID=886882 RepID=E3EKA4_PAEPS|nr:thymidine kinase [Paenibacillus polymyxa]ADO59431.1 thymidine kinase [Paenibacillus polymyxa SC2]WPQ59729.1 thymidine kinase [Paenibacillus polymyxa]